jgi:hypothetical protein
MGYRSKVRICSKKENIERLEKELREKDLFISFDFEQLNEDGTKIIGWDWVKWYPEYDDVSFIEDFIYNLDDCEFVRIGEETGDIEEHYEFDYNERDGHLGTITDIDVY